MTHADVIRAALGALTRRDLPALLDEVFDPDAEIVSWLAAVEGQSRYVGRAGIERWYETILGAWEEFEATLEAVIELDDLAMALVQFRARGRESGAEVVRRTGVVYRIRRGRMLSFHVFPEPADAFEEMARKLRSNPEQL